MYRPATVGLRTARSYAYMARLAEADAAPLHGDCSDPFIIEVVGQDVLYRTRLDQWNADEDLDYYPDFASARYGYTKEAARPALTTAYLSVRCRKCVQCLRVRAKLWTARSIDEIAASNRTWFGTLTLSPESQFIARVKADHAAARGGTRWQSLSPVEQFKDRVKQINPDLTRFLKRVRKNSGAVLRYLLVSEAHKSGDPHFHILIHEHSGSATKAVLEEAWKLGFSHWRLCERDKKAAVYACKYLAKSAITRVRASRNYGTAGPRLMTERMMSPARPFLSISPLEGSSKKQDRLSKEVSSGTPKQRRNKSL